MGNIRLVRYKVGDEVKIKTWEELRKEFAAMTEGEFNMEFGAEFSGIGMENFFSEDQVNSCFTGHNCQMVEMGRPGNVYFAHFDLATSSHNYALVVLHKEFFMNQETKKADFIKNANKDSLSQIIRVENSAKIISRIETRLQKL